MVLSRVSEAYIPTSKCNTLPTRPLSTMHHFLFMYQWVCECIELLSFDYAQINLAIQPRSVDISPLHIHQQSTQRCRNSSSIINTRRSKTLRPATNQSGKVPWQQRERESGEREGDHDRSGFMSLLQCSVTSEHIVSGLLWNYRLVTADWLIMCVLERKRERERMSKDSNFFKMVINIMCVFCVYSTVLSLRSSWRHSRCGWRWVWRTETLLSSSQLYYRYKNTHKPSPWTTMSQSHKFKSPFVLVVNTFRFPKQQKSGYRKTTKEDIVLWKQVKTFRLNTNILTSV